MYATASQAQVVAPPATEVPIPVKPKTDSVPKVKRDTIQPSVGRFRDPRTYEIGRKLEWNREELFASGAVTLIDLLDRVPELITFRSGWIASPQVAAYAGDFRRVRIFYDDIEIDPLDARPGGVVDLTTIQIWTLEHITLERSAADLRIHLRSWRVDRTTPYTRTDLTTGNEETNIYRGYYGKRGTAGQIVQFAGQQYSTTSPRSAGTGDALSILARLGVAHRGWSVDGFVNRTHSNRSTQISPSGRAAVPPLDATYTNAYLRAGAGDAVRGSWLQLTAASQRFAESSAHNSAGKTAAGIVLPRDTADTTASSTQLSLSGGYSLAWARLLLNERLRSLKGRSYSSPSARVELDSRFGALTAVVERDGFRGFTNADATVRLQPLSFVAVTASAAHRTAARGRRSRLASNTLLVTGGLKLLDKWVSAGIVSTDTAFRFPPAVFDSSYRPVVTGPSIGTTASLSGPLWRGVMVDGYVTRWPTARAYQPLYESRAELSFASNFLRRFPSGNFGLKAAGWFDYRGRVFFPQQLGFDAAGSSKTVSALLEIRILKAVISYQQRNLLSYQYEIVPGFEMPRVLAIYGIRWEFWN